MPPALPRYYSSLPPFRAAFAGGLPILTYHCLGPRPRRVRLKGLYVGTALFGRQLAELRAAGFAAEGLDTALDRQAAGPVVALTFDDGCRNVWEHGLPLLAAHGCHATQYLVADLIGRSSEWQARSGSPAEPLMDEVQVREWLAAGHGIGSHTCSHPWLTRIPEADAREEIHASRRKLEDRFGVPVTDFCYPYGDWNPRVRDLVAAAGYRTAVTTESGVNPAGADLLSLRRFTARYPSRRLKDIWQRWRAAWSRT